VNTGTVQVQSGTLDLNDGNAAGGTFAVSSGATLQMTGVNSVTTASSVTGAGTFLLSAGTLSCTSNLVVDCPFTWSGGTIQSAGGVTLNGPSSLSGIGQNAMNLIFGGVLINAGQMTWSGSGTNLLFDSGAITNLAAGTITITADVSATAGGTIGNAGLLLKTNALGTTRFSAAFVNTGTLDVQSGTVSLMGNNTLTGGTLSFGISSPANYGKINLSSEASFKGSLGVNLNGFYWPTAGSAFNLLSYPSETGVLFTNTALPRFITWQTNYNSTAFTLTAGARQTNTAPTALTLSRAGATNLDLAWPGDHTGWLLEAQTNSLPVGLRTNWVIVSGSSSTNEITLPIDVANGAVFFRLVLP
jgi:hypothetical protein